MRIFYLISGVAVVVAMLTGCAIKQHDEFECGLPGGGSFTLRSEYDWYPVAKLLPHVAERLNVSGFNTYYKAKEGGVIHVSGATSGLNNYNYKNIEVAKRECSVFGIVNKVPYEVMIRYWNPKVGGFSSLSLGADKNLIRNPPKSESLPRHVLDEIERLGLSYGRAAIVWRPERLVIERSLVDKNKMPELIAAVYRVESFDEGKTWVNPHVTTKSEAFELGKADEEQCFIARLIRIDSKKIEAHFPPCPVAHKLPD